MAKVWWAFDWHSPLMGWATAAVLQHGLCHLHWMSNWGWEELALAVHWLNWSDLLKEPHGSSSGRNVYFLQLMNSKSKSFVIDLVSFFFITQIPRISFLAQNFLFASFFPHFFLFFSIVKKSVHKISVTLGISLCCSGNFSLFFPYPHLELPFFFQDSSLFPQQLMGILKQRVVIPAEK